MTWILLQSVAPPSAGAISAEMGVSSGLSCSGSTLSQCTASTGLTTGSTRSTLGQRISRLLRSGNDSIWVLGFGGGGVAPSLSSWKIDSGTPKTFTYSEIGRAHV